MIERMLRLQLQTPLLVCQVRPLTKQGQRFLSSLTTADGGRTDVARLIKKFIESSPKSVALNALSHLLSPRNSRTRIASLALPLVSSSSSLYVKRTAYKSMVASLCEMARPCEAEEVAEKMKRQGLKPGLFEYRSIVHGYGRLGLFEDMERSVIEMEAAGLGIDTVCSNMILSSYGMHNAVSEMLHWVERMKHSGVPFSTRTYNSVLNSCPVFMSLLQDYDTFPLSIMELCKALNEDEAMLVQSLMESSVLDEAMEWGSAEVKLDLHGMHLSSAYLIILQWINRILYKFQLEICEIPAQMTIVCGAGNHSNVRGESPLKILVRKMMLRTESPMKIDRKNGGCFMGKGKAVHAWLYHASPDFGRR